MNYRARLSSIEKRLRARRQVDRTTPRILQRITDILARRGRPTRHEEPARTIAELQQRITHICMKGSPNEGY